MTRPRVPALAIALATLCLPHVVLAERLEAPEHTLAPSLALPLAGVSFDATSDATASDPLMMAGPVAAPPPLLARSRAPREPKTKRVRPPVTLSAERARVLLRSLTVPGWGQLTTGHRTAAAVFGIAEAGIWSTYTAFRVQNQLRRDAYMRTARVLGGIDLKGRDEEFQRIVGSYLNSDEYNLLVVARDAANLYYKDPAKMSEYIDAHSLRGADVWAWPDDQALLRFRGQRKNAQRAALRANAALAMAIANRLLSAIHAARLGTESPAQTWQLQAVPANGDPTAFRVGVLRRF